MEVELRWQTIRNVATGDAILDPARADTEAPARGLFGYVAQQATGYEVPDQPLTFGIGGTGSDFKQLAGRVSVNWAVEDGDPRRQGRFLNEGPSACLVPLRPLSSPKPSAVETYLTQDKLGQRQDRGTLCTYGDTLVDQAAGDLNGRKFYLHQPDAAHARECYELTGPGQADWWLGEAANRKLAVLSEQAGIARFVSTPGTEFKFTLRFRDLRTWELGALWLALAADQPLIEHFVENLGLDRSRTPKLIAWLKRVASWKPDDDQRPLLALKVGHGRPLGLGSVRVRVKAMCRLQFDEELRPAMSSQNGSAELDQQRRSAVAALAQRIAQSFTDRQRADWVEQVFVPWLQVHRYAGRKSFDYPRDIARKVNGDSVNSERPGAKTIYNYHTNQRKRHAAGRKLPEAGTARSSGASGGLKSLEDLDGEGQ